MHIELSYIHISVRSAARMMAVNSVGTKVKPQANRNAVTGDRKQTRSLSDRNRLDAKQVQDM